MASPILTQHAVRATFYAATGLLGEEHDFCETAVMKDLPPLEEVGHEIGLPHS